LKGIIGSCGCGDGDVVKKFVLNSGSHNTIYGADGAHAYLAGLKSRLLTVMDAQTREVSMGWAVRSGDRALTINAARRSASST